MEPRVGFEPTLPAWKAGMLTVEHQRGIGNGSQNRTDEDGLMRPGGLPNLPAIGGPSGNRTLSARVQNWRAPVITNSPRNARSGYRALVKVERFELPSRGPKPRAQPLRHTLNVHGYSVRGPTDTTFTLRAVGLRVWLSTGVSSPASVSVGFTDREASLSSYCSVGLHWWIRTTGPFHVKEVR